MLNYNLFDIIRKNEFFRHLTFISIDKTKKFNQGILNLTFICEICVTSLFVDQF